MGRLGKPPLQSTVYVAGHQIPDLDSAASAAVLADMLNAAGDGMLYIPVLQGAPNRQTVHVFEQAGREPPRVLTDLRPTVSEILPDAIVTTSPESPVRDALEELEACGSDALPVLDAQGRLCGVVGTHMPQSRFLHHFNPEDYLGHLIRFEDVVRTLKLERLSEPRSTLADCQGSFRVATDGGQALDLSGPGDVVIAGASEHALRRAMERKVSAVVLCECQCDRARALVERTGALGVYHYGGSLLALVSELPSLTPVELVMEENVTPIPSDTPLEEALPLLAKANHALPVVDPQGVCLGMLDSRSALAAPRRKLAIVDHFEETQSVAGVADSEILRIVDHHRVGSLETRDPVHVDCRPLGSTATILALQMQESGGKPDPAQATLLLGAILSDTLLLTSPTTTATDRSVARQLASTAGRDIEAFGREVLAQNDVLALLPAAELVRLDAKRFRHAGVDFQLGQLETTRMELLDSRRKTEMLAELETLRREASLDMAATMVTNVLAAESFLLVADPDGQRAETVMNAGANTEPGRFPQCVSRKKQMLPHILNALDDWRRRQGGSR